MTLNGLVAEINYAHKGNNKVLAEGSDKWNRTVSILNRKRREWARDATTQWNSLFEVRTVGTFSTDQTVELDDDIHKLSDFIYLESGADWRRFDVVTPQRRREYSQAVYVSGNPKVLTFIDPIAATDSWLGSSIQVPCYFVPEDVTTGTDDVFIDSTEWLIYATAAELARNDPAKDDQFGNLIGMANDLYQAMKDNNNIPPYGQPFDVPVEVFGAGERY
jgi:hypothetical protein